MSEEMTKNVSNSSAANAAGDQQPEVTDLQRRAVNAIRALTIDATQEAGDGHPGMPMGAAPMGYVLFTEAMRHDPHDPSWPNRDRYVQSAGHGSMLQYALLHLTGYDLPMEELKGYRQWDSRTPGHPEYGHTTGVETTTGPLGQGISTAVGLALAEAHLAARFNRPGLDIVDHHTYVIASDGDLMEGVSGEASSFAGHLGLGKLIVLYDDNGISIDGPTTISFSEDVLARYRAYGWHAQRVEDGNDLAQIRAALAEAKANPDRPSLIAVRTVIGYGAGDLAGTSKVHGSPLGDVAAPLAKQQLEIDWPAFTVPDDVLAHYREAVERGERAKGEWQRKLADYREQHPREAEEFERLVSGRLPSDFAADLPSFEPGEKVATRKASATALNAIAKHLPELVGGSADLAGSNYTDIDGESAMTRDDYSGRIVHFGIREHAMAAVANGLALHGLKPFVATFLVFSDYLKPALRLSALMRQSVIYVLTHDSIGLGGDGPTHQPVEHLMALRAVPGLVVLRPADGNETAQAWELAASRDGPTVLALTRQGVPNLEVPADAVRKGAYVISETHSDGSAQPEVILIATGSEVALCLAAKEELERAGSRVRVVSMPSFELFEQQDDAYRESVLPSAVAARVTVEAGATLGWERYAGDRGETIGLDHFGASAPGDVVMREFGFTPERVVEAARRVMRR